MAKTRKESKLGSKFGRDLSDGIRVRLDPKTMAQLRSFARTKGIGPSTLIRIWILEQLQDPQLHMEVHPESRSPR
jgi:hypothetical protein